MHKKQFKRTLVLMVCIAILAVVVSAQNSKVLSKFPGSFPVQYIAQLVDENESPLNGNFEVVARLFDEATGGNLLFESDTMTITIKSGTLLDLTLKDTSNQLSSRIFEDVSYLEIEVGGQIVVPRQVLTANALKPGPPGPRGPKGDKGVKGTKGAKGIPGDRGADGTPGDKGKDGVNGAPGPKGQDGKDGANGAPGPKGQDGKDADPSEIVTMLATDSGFLKKVVDGLANDQNFKVMIVKLITPPPCDTCNALKQALFDLKSRLQDTLNGKCMTLYKQATELNVTPNELSDCLDEVAKMGKQILDGFQALSADCAITEELKKSLSDAVMFFTQAVEALQQQSDKLKASAMSFEAGNFAEGNRLLIEANAKGSDYRRNSDKAFVALPDQFCSKKEG